MENLVQEHERKMSENKPRYIDTLELAEKQKQQQMTKETREKQMRSIRGWWN